MNDDLESLGPDTPPRRVRWLVPLAVVAVGAITIAASVWASGDSADEVTTVVGDEPAAGVPANDSSVGLVRVRLEPTTGFFTEGFELGLRFEQADGTVIASILWSDFVGSTGATGIEAYYQSVLEQPVPPGLVVVRAELNIGAGPGPVIPDLAGELRCRLEIDARPEVTVDVEVVFDEGTECVRLLPPTETPETTALAAPSTPPTLPEPGPVVVGSSHSVDVDLVCAAFELDGEMWALDEGDVSDWQPEGERHEGGIFTLDAADHGTFVGDAQGRKTATFARVHFDPITDVACWPTPR